MATSSTPQKKLARKSPEQHLDVDQVATSYRFVSPGVRISKPTKKKGTQRRRAIISAFLRCVRRHGYFNTTMAEIATEADIQPGHLTYYFSNKKEILRCCYVTQATVIVKGLERAKSYHGEDKIEYLAQFFFTDSTEVNCFKTGFMFEAFGVALNDPDIRQDRERMDECIRENLVRVLQDLQQGESSCPMRDKAEVAYAVIPGLKFTLYFGELPGLDKGRELFAKTLRVLTGRDSF